MQIIFNFFAEAVRQIISICIAAALLTAWALTGPLFYWSDLHRERFNKKIKGTL